MKLINFIKQKIRKHQTEDLIIHFRLEDLSREILYQSKERIEDEAIAREFFNYMINKRKNLYIYPLK